MLLIFTLSSVPGKTINEAGLGNDNYHISGHFLMFFILFFALYRAVKNVWISLIITIVFAFSDEFHQLYTPGRSASFKDIFTDTLAGVFAGFIIWSSYPKLPKTLKNWLGK